MISNISMDGGCAAHVIMIDVLLGETSRLRYYISLAFRTARFAVELEQEQTMEQFCRSGLRVLKRSNVVAIGEEVTQSKEEVEENMKDGDDLLKCFAPLLNSMRLFGLYFTRPPHRTHVDDRSRSSTSAVTADTEVPGRWNAGRIYATVILVVMWLNVVRVMTVFDKTDKFGTFLLLKLSVVVATLLSSLLQTSVFVACQTGNLDRIFREAKPPKSDHIRYRRLAVLHSILCWTVAMVEYLLLVIPLFVAHEENWGLSMAPFEVHVMTTGPLLVVMKLLMTTLYLIIYAAWIFPQSVNYNDCQRILQAFKILRNGLRT